MSTEESDLERWSDAPPNHARRAAEPPKTERVHGTPAPQYGEYAPEGWRNPILAEQERREHEEQMRAALAGQHPTSVPNGAAGAVPVRPALRFGRSIVDLVITAILFAFGLDTVVRQLAVRSAAKALANQFAVQYTALSDPSALVMPTAVTAIVGVLLLIGAFVWSFFRAKRRKTTFWVPLLAGAVWTVVSVVLYMIVIMQDSALTNAILHGTR